MKELKYSEEVCEVLVMKKNIILVFLLNAYLNAATLDNKVGSTIEESLEEVHGVALAEKGLEKELSFIDCFDEQNVVVNPSQWSDFLKLNMIETGTKVLSDQLSKQDVKKPKCKETIDINPNLKLWNDKGSISKILYHCPKDTDENPAGVLPSVIMETTIDSKNCFMSFRPEILDEIFRTKEQVRFSESSLSKYVSNISCTGEDKKIEQVVFALDENNNLKIIRDDRFDIKDVKVFNPFYNLSLVGVGAGAKFDLNGPYVGAAFSATLVGNVISLYGGAPVKLDHLLNTMMLSEESKKNVKQYMKDNNITGDTQLYFSAAQIGGTNYLLENTDYSYDEFTRQLTSVGISNVVGTSVGENGDVTLQLNTSVSQSAGFAVRAGGHYRVNDDIDIYTSYGVDSSIKATYDVGDAYGVTLGAKYSELGGPGACTGYFNQKKNGVKSKYGICISQNGGEIYTQSGCPELFGTSCSMSVTSILPTLGFIDVKNIRMLRPGEYYRLEDGNLVGLRKMQDDNGEDYYHFQLYQYPKEVNELRNEIVEKEEQVMSLAPVAFEDIDLSSKENAQIYKSWLDDELIPLLQKSGKDIKGVRIDLSVKPAPVSKSRAKKPELKNYITSDGVLVVKRLDASLNDLDSLEVDYSLKRKDTSEDEIDQELSNILNQLKSSGVLIDLDLKVLTKKEQEGLKLYLKFLAANFGFDGLKGRRLIFTEDPTRFLGFGEEPFNFSGTDIKISIGLLEKLTKLDFSQSVPTDMTPRKPADCKDFKDKKKEKCMQDSLLSVVYGQNFQVGGRKIEFLTRDQMRDLVPSKPKGSATPGLKNRVPFTKVIDDKVYVLSDAEKIEDYLEPGVFHSPIKSLRKLMIPSELEESVDLLQQTAGKNTFTYEQNRKNHRVKVANNNAELFNFKNRGNDQYKYMTVYEDDVEMSFQGKPLSNCVEVKNGIATVYYVQKGLKCGQYSADKASVAGSVNLNKPDENSAAYNDIFKKYLPILFEVKELKE